MTENPVQNLKRQILIFNQVQRSDALNVMGKFSYLMFLTEIREAGFPKVPVWNVSDIVPQSDSFYQVFIKTQAPPDGSCDL